MKKGDKEFKELRDNVYKKYKSSVNMSYSEFKKWSESECSNKASLNRAPIKRNLILLKKPKSKWTEKDIKEAKKTIAFNSRMIKVKPGKPVCKNKSKRDISLLNWALNPFKKLKK